MLLPKCWRITYSNFIIYFVKLGMDPKSQTTGSDAAPVDGKWWYLAVTYTIVDLNLVNNNAKT